MILLTLPFWRDNAAQAEQLLEFIFAQNDRQQLKAHILLVNAPTVDKELTERIKISAELAFAGVYQLELRPLADERAPKWKQINNAFTQAATHIHKTFRWPFLWMDPDCVPTRRGWHSRLVLEYGSQPKAYLGSRMKISAAGKPDMFLMARNGIYPVNAITDVPAAEAPYEIASAVNVFPKFNSTKVFQQAILANESDLVNVRPEAVMVHGDKNGFLRRQLEVSFTPQEVSTSVIAVASETTAASESVPITQTKRRGGRPSKAELANRLARLNGNQK